MGQPKPSMAQQQQQQQMGAVGAAAGGRLAPACVTRAPHTPSPGVQAAPSRLTSAGPRGGLLSSSTPTTHRPQPDQQQQQGAAAAGGDHRHMHYTLEQLNGMVLKELSSLCAGRGLPSSGRKADLVRRLLEYQRRLQRASRPS